jgi:TM2 domain-containing membrane protein YozV
VDFEVNGDDAKGVFRALSEPTLARPQSKSKAATTLWAILLGGFGAHKFYMGSWGWGIVYLLTCWLYVPFLVAFVEWVRYVLMTGNEFYAKTESFYRQKPGPFSFFC